MKSLLEVEGESVNLNSFSEAESLLLLSLVSSSSESGTASSKSKKGPSASVSASMSGESSVASAPAFQPSMVGRARKQYKTHKVLKDNLEKENLLAIPLFCPLRG